MNKKTSIALRIIIIVLLFLAVLELPYGFYTFLRWVVTIVMVLSAISFGLFLIITIAVRAANMRLFLTVAILPVVYAFFGMRMLQLRFGGSWPVKWTAVIAVTIAQFTIGLYYWPLSPVRFGLLLMGPAYALIGFASSLDESPAFSDISMEPFIMLGVIWLLAIILG